jgi:hypothetical protein
MNVLTTEDMIRFFYNEMSAEEALKAKEAIEQDSELRELYQHFQSTLNTLDTVRLSPEQSSIDRIMRYANDKVY